MITPFIFFFGVCSNEEKVVENSCVAEDKCNNENNETTDETNALIDEDGCETIMKQFIAFIRFANMNIVYFEKNVINSGLLTKDEIIEISFHKLQATTRELQSTKFDGNPRITSATQRLDELKRYFSQRYLEYYEICSLRVGDKIDFRDNYRRFPRAVIKFAVRLRIVETGNHDSMNNMGCNGNNNNNNNGSGNTNNNVHNVEGRIKGYVNDNHSGNHNNNKHGKYHSNYCSYDSEIWSIHQACSLHASHKQDRLPSQYSHWGAKYDA